MGLFKKIKKAVSNPKNIIKSAAAVTTGGLSLTKPGAKVVDGVNSAIFDGKEGPDNPFSEMPNGYLGDTSRLDFLKGSADKFSYLKDPSQYSFLDSFTPNTSKSDSYFQSYLDSVSGPSSVDAVRGSLESEDMGRLLAGVDEDTRQAAGNVKGDFLDRGLGGPGMISDIEGSALTGAYSEGAKNRGAIRSDFANKQLDRLKAQEAAKQAALAARYGAGVTTDNANNAIANQRQVTKAGLIGSGNEAYAGIANGNDNLFAQLINARDLGMAGINSTNFNAAAERQQKYKKKSIFDTLLDNTQINVGG